MLTRAIYQKKREKGEEKLIDPILPSSMTVFYKFLAHISITTNKCEICNTCQKFINMQHVITQSFFS